MYLLRYIFSLKIGTKDKIAAAFHQQPIKSERDSKELSLPNSMKTWKHLHLKSWTSRKLLRFWSSRSYCPQWTWSLTGTLVSSWSLAIILTCTAMNTLPEIMWGWALLSLFHQPFQHCYISANGIIWRKRKMAAMAECWHFPSPSSRFGHSSGSYIHLSTYGLFT